MLRQRKQLASIRRRIRRTERRRPNNLGRNFHILFLRTHVGRSLSRRSSENYITMFSKSLMVNVFPVCNGFVVRQELEIFLDQPCGLPGSEIVLCHFLSSLPFLGQRLDAQRGRFKTGLKLALATTVVIPRVLK